MAFRWIRRWPLLRQILRRADGTGEESMSRRTLEIAPRTDGAEVARSVCPYCGVGCGQLVHHRRGELVAIEGDPESPVNRGTLCPKGAASHQLLTHENRLERVLYRPPRATEWRELDLDTAMEMVADRVWKSRRRTFVRDTTDLPEDDPSRTGPAEGGGAETAGTEDDGATAGGRSGTGGSDGGAAERVGHTSAVAHLGGATLDNEENYLLKKLFTGGLGMVAVSNQARI